MSHGPPNPAPQEVQELQVSAAFQVKEPASSPFPFYRPELTGQDGASPAVQCLSLHAPITGDTGLIPHQGRAHMLLGTAKTVEAMESQS